MAVGWVETKHSGCKAGEDEKEAAKGTKKNKPGEGGTPREKGVSGWGGKGSKRGGKVNRAKHCVRQVESGSCRGHRKAACEARKPRL